MSALGNAETLRLDDEVVRVYRDWAGRLSVSLRQTYAPGEKLFVDYAVPSVPVTDPLTGEIR